MNKPNITTWQAARCLEILRASDTPLLAAELAARLGIEGNHETQRRHVRALIKHLRDNGSMIVATLADGYYLTDDEQLWKDYLEGRQIDAKRILAVTHRRKRMLADSKGQGMFFTPKIICGCATQAAN